MNEQALDRARAAWQAGDIRQTGTLCAQVLATDPNNTDALMLAVNVAFAGDDMAAALPHLERLAGLLPEDPMIHTNLGQCYLAFDDPPAAERAFRGALALAQEDARAWDGLGVSLHRQGHYGDAEKAHRRATELTPDFASSWCNLGIALTDLGDYAEAGMALDRALALDANDPKTRFNRSIINLLQGDYAGGWPLYESRLALRGDRPPPGNRWRGDALPSNPLLIFPEQGFGDFIHFVRYVPIVAERVGAVVLAVPPPLQTLVEAQNWPVTCVPVDQPAAASHWCPLMSLPGILGMAPETLHGGPYLKADEAAIRRWRAKRGSGLNVGLVWAGNPTHRRDRDRSIDPDCLRSLLDVPGISWRSLQVGKPVGCENLFTEVPELEDFGGDCEDFSATAAALNSLDLVISVDTAVLHLAGALGVPAWGLLPFVPDWRWGSGGSTTPWYTSLRLFRQPGRGDWSNVIGRVRAELSQLATGG